MLIRTRGCICVSLAIDADSCCTDGAWSALDAAATTEFTFKLGQAAKCS
jgi:hypothetical protein